MGEPKITETVNYLVRESGVVEAIAGALVEGVKDLARAEASSATAAMLAEQRLWFYTLCCLVDVPV